MALSTDQLALKALLDTQPLAWVDFTAEQRDLLRATLRPTGPFTDAQRELLENRWLPITSEQLAQAQALLPPNIGIAPRADVDGGLWVGAYLLTDCVEGTDTYHAIAPILAHLPITLVPPDQFPQSEIADI